MTKPIGHRIRDGARNFLRHGRIRAPEFDLPAAQRAPRVPRSLAPVSARIKALRHLDAAATRQLLEEHEERYLAAGQDKFLAFAWYHAGALEKAAAFVDGIAPEQLNANEHLLAGRIRSDWRALAALREGRPPVGLAARGARFTAAAAPAPLPVLYIAASSLPYLVTGYTSRTDAVVRALADDPRFDIHPVTRPGFPADRPDAARVEPAETRFDRLDSPADYRGDLDTYLAAALPPLRAMIEDRSIALVHAASNFRNGAIGLALARAAGLPFVYEVRGLWEETTDSKIAGWRDTERFEMERRFEQFLVAEADGVLAINAQVRDTLVDGRQRNVRLLPNSVARERIRIAPGAREGATLRLGYIGSLVDYEGLDDVLGALAILAAEGLDFSYDIYGDGKERERLAALSRRLGLSPRVTFHGRVAPAEVPLLYDGFDLCVFARKDRRVCRLVSPLKPIEAMANDTACLLSDLPPLAEIAGEGNALLCAPGDPASIAAGIARFAALTGPERARIRDAARSNLAARFTWEAQRDVVAAVYEEAFVTRPDAAASQPRAAG